MKLTKEQYKLITKMFIRQEDLNGNEKRTAKYLEQTGLIHRGPKNTLSLTPDAFEVINRGRRIHQERGL